MANGADPNESTSVEPTDGQAIPTTAGADANGSTSSTFVSVRGLPDGEPREAALKQMHEERSRSSASSSSSSYALSMSGFKSGVGPWRPRAGHRVTTGVRLSPRPVPGPSAGSVSPVARTH